jgi:1,4-alpha-glucan branching enzyme
MDPAATVRISPATTALVKRPGGTAQRLHRVAILNGAAPWQLFKGNRSTNLTAIVDPGSPLYTSTTLATHRAGMGCILHDQGAAFRVWAPNAEEVYVIGTFNDWDESAAPMQRESNGHWYVDVPGVNYGDEYLYLILNGDARYRRIDPYAREVTNSVGNAVVHDPSFDWQGDDFTLPPFNELVIYEMHVGTFNATEGDGPGTFGEVGKKLAYLKRLGINAIQLMPLAEFAGDYSWGYNPAHIYAVESAYGGPRGLKRLVRLAHQHGIGVILDVVYNHFGPSDLSLWQFDGWSESGKGGIYFYNDWRSKTPWGDSRPDYGRGEVRSFIHDNATMWLEEYHMDGLRYDMTLFIRSVDGTEQASIPEGWSLAQWINRSLKEKYPKRITIAEDLQNNEWLTKPVDFGGAGFNSQWDAGFVHPVRAAVQATNDADRSMHAVRDAICHRYNIDAFERVIYSESHDEVANGKQRVTSEIDSEDPTGLFAQKRSVLAAALVFTAPGIPMLFQAQEFLRFGWFDDGNPIDWDQCEEFRGIVRLYQDLIRLRLNREGNAKGLTGQHVAVTHLNDFDKVIAFHRWHDESDSDVMVVLNFANRTLDNYRIGLPHAGDWTCLFSSDAKIYSELFGDAAVGDIRTESKAWDGLEHSGRIVLPPYAAVVYGRNAIVGE